jgi:hypothetical protein
MWEIDYRSLGYSNKCEYPDKNVDCINESFFRIILDHGKTIFYVCESHFQKLKKFTSQDYENRFKRVSQ